MLQREIRHLLLALSLLASGCGDDDGQSQNNNQEPTPDGAVPATAEADPNPQPDPLGGSLADWLLECGTATSYPCPPYGDRRFDILADHVLIPGNPEAEAWTDVSGVFHLHDYYQSGAEGLFVFLAAGWDPWGTAEAQDLPGLYTEYQSQGIEFLCVVLQDESGDLADTPYADAYASQHGFNFATITDPDGFWLHLLQGGFPANLFIDLGGMQILQSRNGAMFENDIRALLESFLSL